METTVRLRNATIKWGYPFHIDTAFTKDICHSGYGIYCISRVFNGKETILYIGKTNNNFFSRLNDHYFKWINNYRGTKKVRFGTIVTPKIHTDELIKDLEGALISDLQPVQNICRKKYYSYHNIYKINNIGKRGDIPRWINMREHL